jgi:hypothetical protein
MPRSRVPQSNRPRSGRLLLFEGFESRHLLAFGDLVEIIDTPTAESQAGAQFGFSVGAGASGGMSGAPLFDVTKNGITYTDAGRVRNGAVSIDNPTPHDGDQFGYAVSAGEYVSAPGFDDGSLTNSGAVFHMSPASSGVILNPVSAVDSYFGLALATSGRYLFVTVGAPGGSIAAGGAVYVFRDGAFVTAIANPAPAAGDEFGRSLAVTSNQLIVGAPGDDSAGENAGTVYIFDFSGNLLRTILDPEASPGDRFGAALVNTSFSLASVAIGAPGTAVKGDSGAGRAYHISLVDGTVVARLDNPIPAEGDGFGSALSVISTNGLNPKVIVGAPYADDGDALDSGLVYTFSLTNGALLNTIHNPTPADGDLFGFSVFASSAIGAPGADERGTVDGGALYSPIPDWSPTLAWDYAPHGRFGDQMVAAGPWLFVTEPWIHNNTTYLGRVHQFDAETKSLVHTYDTDHQSVPIGAEIAASSQRFAATRGGQIYVFDTTTHARLFQVDRHDEADGDDRPDGPPLAMDDNVLVVGSRRSGSGKAGQVRVYDAATGALQHTFIDPTNNPSNQFGIAVAIANGKIAVAANGSTFIYDSISGDLLHTLAATGGRSLLFSGDRLVIGSPTAVGTSRVRVFDWATETLQYTLPPAAQGYFSEGFGSSLAVVGETLLIGDVGSAAQGTPGKLHVAYLPTGALLETIAPATASSDFGTSIVATGTSTNAVMLVSDPDARGPYFEIGRIFSYDASLSGLYVGGIYGPSQYVENSGAIRVTPNLAFTNPGHASFDGGMLSAAILSPHAGDRLGIESDDPLAGQLTVNGNEILYQETLVATFALSAQDKRLEVALGPDASDDAIQAILRHITFINSKEDFVAGTRTIRLNIVTGDGALSMQATQAVNVVAVDDPGVLTLSGDFHYVEDAPPVLVAGNATYSDVDFHLSGTGGITAQITGGVSGDRLVVVHQGTGLGEVQVVGSNVFIDSKLVASTFFFPQQRILSISLHPGSTVDTVRSILRRVGFSSDSQNPTNAIRTVSFTVGQTVTSNTSFITVEVEPRNDAPTVSPANPSLGSIAEDSIAADINGELVSSVFGGISDADGNGAKGIAVFSLSGNDNGNWQYSLDDGATWMAMGDPTNAAARLFGATNKVRFLPNPNFSGTAKLFFLAWDQSDGLAEGSTASTIGLQGGTSPYSSANDIATLTVAPINDAPMLNTNVSVTLGSFAEDTPEASITGTPVSDLLAGVTDLDTDALKGIAIVGRTEKLRGSWQYSIDAGANWLPLGTPTDSTARLLLPADRVRFVPYADYNGAPQLVFRAWDRTNGLTTGSVADTTGQTGGSGAYSTASKAVKLTVTPVNDAPALALSGSLGYKRNDPAVVLAPNATLTDIDSPNFDGGELRVRIAVGGGNNNTLAIGSGFTVDQDNNVFFGTTLIGTRISSGIGTSELKVRFNASATKEVVQALVRSITYSNFGGSAGQRKIEFTVSDGDGGLSDVRTKTVNVT